MSNHYVFQSDNNWTKSKQNTHHKAHTRKNHCHWIDGATVWAAFLFHKLKKQDLVCTDFKTVGQYCFLSTQVSLVASTPNESLNFFLCMYVSLTPPPLPAVCMGLVKHPVQCVTAYTLSSPHWRAPTMLFVCLPFSCWASFLRKRRDKTLFSLLWQFQ